MSENFPHRIIIFTEANTYITSLVIRTLLKVTQEREDVELVAVCVPKLKNFWVKVIYSFLEQIIFRLQALFNDNFKIPHRFLFPLPLRVWAKRYGFSLLIETDVNSSSFIKKLKDDIKPSFSFTFGYQQRFSRDLLAVLGKSINFHDSLLPKYRGVEATGWSKYKGERETGFTFHYMNEKYDDGSILLQKKIMINKDKISPNLLIKKIHLAVEQIPRLLDLVIADNKGQPQVGEPSYHSVKDRTNILVIDNISELPSTELVKRLKGFGNLWINFSGSYIMATDLEEITHKKKSNSRYSFCTSDGVYFRVVRFNYLPFVFYWLITKIFGNRFE